ncbi:hypothetical protein ZIOFF_031469 [Zingiber officinale]|uniref:Uncharacterized protein n=1 Tax=Zingiber officinale TaxID=94328 RepID=A0A8J5LA14_ZINOF|nr:hypothetical protein ZIOFF_031469 [Zingiber officinale]
MASSVARISVSHKWFELAGLSNADALGGCSFNPSHLHKVIAPQRQTADVRSPSPDRSEEDGGSPGILERWESLQARELVTTLDRQAREAEISALATVSRPVSARAKSFLREASDSSSAGTAAASAVDLPRSVRASSLIQMWRGLEADAAVSPKNSPENSGDNATSTAASSSADELFSDNSGDSDSDIAAAPNSSSSSRERTGRVENIVRMLSSGSSTPAVASSPKNPAPTADNTSSDRRYTKDFVAGMEQERRRELAALTELLCVSQFQHHRLLCATFGLTELSTPMEFDELHKRTAISHPRRNQFLEKQCKDEDSYLADQFNAKRYGSESTYPNTNSSREGNHSTIGSWDERNLCMADLLPSNGWHGEVHQPSGSRRQWTVRRQPMCAGFFQKFADNAEMIELYERRRVSDSLDSDFCNELNTMVLSLLEMQRKRTFAQDDISNDEDHPFWQKMEECSNNSESVVDIFSSCSTAQNHTMCQSECRKHASSPHRNDLEYTDELRDGIVQIHVELQELRKLVESCLKKQVELHDSIKEDIFDAIRQSSVPVNYNEAGRSSMVDIVQAFHIP